MSSVNRSEPHPEKRSGSISADDTVVMEGIESEEWLEAEVAAAFAESNPEPLPEELRALVARDLESFSAGMETGRVEVASLEREATLRGAPTTRWFAAVAVAGLLASFAFGYWAARQAAPVVVQPIADDSTNLVQDDLEPAVAPEDWAKDPRRKRLAFGVTGDAGEAFAEASGEVIWDPELQEGFMRLVGLPVNDPKVSQYQLWIIDPARGEIPVDGGVFDVDGGEIWVPIDAKLDVPGPEVFAITSEVPGGVVVSKGPLLLTAAL